MTSVPAAVFALLVNKGARRSEHLRAVPELASAKRLRLPIDLNNAQGSMLAELDPCLIAHG